jgi:hypothetical protein
MGWVVSIREPVLDERELMCMQDLDANIARDKHARLCTQVEGLVSSLKTSQSDDTLAELSEQLV